MPRQHRAARTGRCCCRCGAHRQRRLWRLRARHGSSGRGGGGGDTAKRRGGGAEPSTTVVCSSLVAASRRVRHAGMRRCDRMERSHVARERSHPTRGGSIRKRHSDDTECASRQRSARQRERARCAGERSGSRRGSRARPQRAESGEEAGGTARQHARPRRSRPSRGAAASGLETRAVLGGAREAGEAPGPLYRRGQLSAAPARHGRACGREAVPDAASIPYALRSRWHRRSADTGRGLAARAPDAAALATRGTHGGACRRGPRCGTARAATICACGDCGAGACAGSAGRVVAAQQTR